MSPALVCTVGDGAVVAELEAGDLDAGLDLGARLLRLAGEAEHRFLVEGVAAGALVQADGEAGRPPVAV